MTRLKSNTLLGDTDGQKGKKGEATPVEALVNIRVGDQARNASMANGLRLESSSLQQSFMRLSGVPYKESRGIARQARASLAVPQCGRSPQDAG